MGILYLLPVPLHPNDGTYDHQIIRNTVSTCKHVIAESTKMAKRHLYYFGHPHLDAVKIFILNEHTPETERSVWIHQIQQESSHWLLLSDAGCPAIADPGTELVLSAHRNGITVSSVGINCSITLAVMLSGLSGQRFLFEGYLPSETTKRRAQIKLLERQSASEKRAVFCIETPYRNAVLWQDLLLILHPKTLVFLGYHFGSTDAFSKTQTVNAWKNSEFVFKEKVPCIFGFMT